MWLTQKMSRVNLRNFFYSLFYICVSIIYVLYHLSSFSFELVAIWLKVIVYLLRFIFLKMYDKWKVVIHWSQCYKITALSMYKETRSDICISNFFPAYQYVVAFQWMKARVYYLSWIVVYGYTPASPSLFLRSSFKNRVIIALMVIMIRIMESVELPTY